MDENARAAHVRMRRWWARLTDQEYEAHCARLSELQRARLGDKVLPAMSDAERRRYWKLRDRRSGLGFERAPALAIVMQERAAAFDRAYVQRLAELQTRGSQSSPGSVRTVAPKRPPGRGTDGLPIS